MAISVLDSLSGSTEIYPEWQHISKVVASHAEIARSSPGLTEAVPIYMYCALLALRGYCPVKGGGKASQLYLPSLTLLFVAGSGRLQLGATHWATWVTSPEVVDN